MSPTTSCPGTRGNPPPTAPTETKKSLFTYQHVETTKNREYGGGAGGSEERAVGMGTTEAKNGEDCTYVAHSPHASTLTTTSPSLGSVHGTSTFTSGDIGFSHLHAVYVFGCAVSAMSPIV